MLTPDRTRLQALAPLALKSYSNSYRELSRWDSTQAALTRSNRYIVSSLGRTALA